MVRKYSVGRESFLDKKHELIDLRWPRSVIHKVGEVAFSLSDEVEEEVPRIFRHYLQLGLLVLEELDPLAEERASVCQQQLPQITRCLHLDILESFLCRVTKCVPVERGKVFAVFQLGVKACLKNLFPGGDRVTAKLLTAFQELLF